MTASRWPSASPAALADADALLIAHIVRCGGCATGAVRGRGGLAGTAVLAPRRRESPGAVGDGERVRGGSEQAAATVAVQPRGRALKGVNTDKRVAGYAAPDQMSVLSMRRVLLHT